MESGEPSYAYQMIQYIFLAGICGFAAAALFDAGLIVHKVVGVIFLVVFAVFFKKLIDATIGFGREKGLIK